MIFGPRSANIKPSDKTATPINSVATSGGRPNDMRIEELVIASFSVAPINVKQLKNMDIIGVISGPCSPVPEPEGITYTRAVTWNKTAPRDVLSQSSKNSLGGIQTIFAISAEVMADLESAASHERPAAGAGLVCNPDEPAQASSDDSSSDDEALAATYDNGIELIKDRVSQLGWEDMERLVAGVLKAMGYCARVTPKGPDGGRDVIASPDALGLESPRIVAEVKHRKGAMGASAVRSFIGGLRAGDRGLYVSTGGFTKEARYEADRANVPVRPLDLDAFVLHYVEAYDKTNDETRGSSRSPASGGRRSEQPRREFGHAASSVYPRRA